MARTLGGSIIGALLAVGIQLAPTNVSVAPAQAETPAPKAVFIVGPTNGLTESNLADATRMADQAAAEGMDVRRVFSPNATWDNVLTDIQGASLVVYMGHGYGWPSRYTTRLTESRQNGFGLSSFRGSGRAQYTYYGATPIRENVELAPNAVVMLIHGCYTAGNGEPGTAIPTEALARERIDNYASGFLAAGARAVFAFGWNQKLNYARALATTDSTMEELFMTSGGGSPAGYIGWRDRRLDSVRTPGASIHVDPHPTYGYYRALTGDPSMTAADWRSGAGQLPAEPPATIEPPQITELVAGSDSASDVAAATSKPASFHPNGDGLDDVLLVRHTVTRAGFLEATVRDDAGAEVRAFTVWSAAGAGTSQWDGRDQGGAVVPDGRYTLTFVPRDQAGATGEPASVSAMVLTAIAEASPSKAAVHVSDADTMARSSTFKVTLNQPAYLTWRIVDAAGRLVGTVRDGEQVPQGTLMFTWDGRADDGRWVADGTQRSVVSAQTGLGEYSQERPVLVGAFQVNLSSAAPARGETVTVNLFSTESLDRNPTVQVTQAGLASWKVSARHVAGRRYRASVTLQAGWPAGAVEFYVSGIDTRGGRQSSVVSVPLQ
jgi:flagellar hook assembly protein FlgD